MGRAVAAVRSASCHQFTVRPQTYLFTRSLEEKGQGTKQKTSHNQRKYQSPRQTSVLSTPTVILVEKSTTNKVIISCPLAKDCFYEEGVNVRSMPFCINYIMIQNPAQGARGTDFPLSFNDFFGVSSSHFAGRRRTFPANWSDWLFRLLTSHLPSGKHGGSLIGQFSVILLDIFFSNISNNTISIISPYTLDNDNVKDEKCEVLPHWCSGRSTIPSLLSKMSALVFPP